MVIHKAERKGRGHREKGKRTQRGVKRAKRRSKGREVLKGGAAKRRTAPKL